MRSSAFTWAVASSAALLAAGCLGDLSAGPARGRGGEAYVPPTVVPGDCATPEQMFADRLFPQVIGPTCMDCHTATGAASMSRFLLVTAAEDPEWMRTNFATVSEIAATHLPDHDNRSLLELKPSGAVMHGGAVAIPPGGAAHLMLLDFIARLDGVMCDPDEEPPLPYPFYDDVTFVEPVALLRRVTLDLAGRLPTDAERTAVLAGGLDALRPILDTLLEDERFLDRLREVFNDVLLTRGRMETGVLAYEYYPDRYWPSDVYGEPEVYRVNADYTRALYDEPVELVAYIVRNDRPITEILTADYTVVSPYTARGYGVFDEARSLFADENDPFEFVPFTLPARVSRTGAMEPTPDGRFPHAGILSMPQWLVRYPSTDTNRNRARARHFFQLFLGYDIMASAPAVTDAAAVVAMYPPPHVPTLEAPDCVVCHTTLDPVAGLFQRFDNRGDYQFRTTPWFTDMFPPGFAGEEIPESEMGASLRWLGERAANDPRFAVAMAEYAYYLLTQERVMLEPAIEDPIATAMLRGYLAQRDAIDAAATALVGSGFDFKAAIRSLVFSDFYRANGVRTPPTDARRVAELGVLGASALYTPEQLVRNTRAIFGVSLSFDPNMPTDTPYLLYGGIDFLDVTQRATLPNGVMGALMRSNAHTIACGYALRELWGEGVAPQPLFPFVDADTVDEASVRRNLVHLHRLVLGQELAVDSLEIDRTHGLFEAVRTEGAARVASGDDTVDLPYWCRAEASGVPDDADYVMRAWQSVITYLVRRPEYLLAQ